MFNVARARFCQKPIDDLGVADLGFSYMLPPHHQNVRVMEKVIQNLEGLSLENDRATTTKELGVEDFEVLKFIGSGGFAEVYQVRKIDTSEIFAMKVIKKDTLMKKLDHGQSINSEGEIMARIDHPFIVRLRYSFQTDTRLHLVLDYVVGGELHSHIKKQGLFLEDVARVYAAEIVSAVSHLHANGITHRDIKSENVLLDAEGHVALTDFGLAEEFNGSHTSLLLCGTLKYMAPEVLLRTSQVDGTVADWWSFGVLLYQMLAGHVPFQGSRREIMVKILTGKIRLPSFLTEEAHSLLRGLLTRDASERLGRRGGEEVKAHKWFSSIDWKKLEAREIRPG